MAKVQTGQQADVAGSTFVVAGIGISVVSCNITAQRTLLMEPEKDYPGVYIPTICFRCIC